MSTPSSVTESIPDSIKRSGMAGGKAAGRKRRPESVMGPGGAGSATAAVLPDQAWNSAAAVAALSMSRIRGSASGPSGGAGGVDAVMGSVDASRGKMKNRLAAGSGDELDDAGVEGGDMGGVATLGATRRHQTTFRKRVPNVGEEGEHGAPVPGVGGNHSAHDGMLGRSLHDQGKLT
ncbi:hypothetical protein HK101_006396, partial [Irineochytrium annulatum]